MFKKKLKVRRLVVDDIFLLAKILSNISEKAGQEVVKILVQEGDTSKLSEEERKEKELEIGIKLAETVFRVCLFHAEDDFKKWVANILGVSRRRVGKLTFVELKEIINQIKENEDISGFFGDAFTSFRKMNDTAKQFTGK
jgi:hypothetical protein